MQVDCICNEAKKTRGPMLSLGVRDHHTIRISTVSDLSDGLTIIATPLITVKSSKGQLTPHVCQSTELSLSFSFSLIPCANNRIGNTKPFNSKKIN